MSWFFNSQPTNDLDWAREAMTYFHNRSLGYSGYSLTLNQLIDRVGGYPDGKSPPEIFLESLGFAITSIDMTSGQVQDAMERLADVGQGRVPQFQSVFFKALSDRVQDISVMDWVSATPTIALETAGDIVKGAQAVGDAVIDTGKSLLFIGPLLTVAAVIFIGWSYTKRAAGG